jgi:hypothetical protein
MVSVEEQQNYTEGKSRPTTSHGECVLEFASMIKMWDAKAIVCMISCSSTAS